MTLHRTPLYTIAATGGSEFIERYGWELPAAYTDPGSEYQSATTAVAVHDASYMGRLKATGADALDLLNRLSTNKVADLEPGQGAPTILTTDRGRILDVIIVVHAGDHTLLLTSPGTQQPVIEFLDRYTIMEDLTVEDVSPTTAMLALWGPDSGAFLEKAAGVALRRLPLNHTYLAEVGRCIGPVRRPGPILIDSLKFLMAETRSPVKITLPGPMTVVDSIFDDFYHDEAAFAFAVADALNEEAQALDSLGPTVIQFDEPVFSRYPEKVADWGIEALNRGVAGIAAKTAVHVCFSYPIPGLDRPVKPSYPRILLELNKSKVDQLALEFEAPQLDLALLRLCPDKTILLGCINNGSEIVESPEQIASRLLSAAKHHPPEMLQAAPDCGLVPLNGAAARAKLAAMVQGASLARERV